MRYGSRLINENDQEKLNDFKCAIIFATQFCSIYDSKAMELHGHVTLLAEKLLMSSAPVLLCLSINPFVSTTDASTCLNLLRHF